MLPARSALASENADELNFRFAPLSLLIGWLNVDLDVRISENWTVGPTIGVWRINVPDSYFVGEKYLLKRNSFGVRANWSHNGAFKTGFYLSPIVQFVRAEASGVSASSGNSISATASATTFTGIAGYQWFSDSFNITAGAGFIAGRPSDVSVVDGATNYKIAGDSRDAGFALDFMLGWTF